MTQIPYTSKITNIPLNIQNYQNPPRMSKKHLKAQNYQDNNTWLVTNIIFFFFSWWENQ